ncbi:MAG: TIR domain-containing protein [Rhodospirillales bacterium]
MNDIFISYAREDKAWAHRLADVLEARGWSAWWDAEIPPGETWDEVIERELTAAKAVIVLWSAVAVKKRWVKTEASLALDADKLLPVLIDGALPPLAFRPIQAVSLADWRGEADHEGFAQLLGSIERLVGAPGQPVASATPSVRRDDKPDARPEDRPGASRRRWPLFVGGAGVVAAAAIAGLMLLSRPSVQYNASLVNEKGEGYTASVARKEVVPPTQAPAPPPQQANAVTSGTGGGAQAGSSPLASPSGSPPGVYPQASERLLTDADLSGLSADQLRLMRNEIFARHGRAFVDPALRDYFSAQPWYRPVSGSGDGGRLSPIEQANVVKIRSFETSKN